MESVKRFFLSFVCGLIALVAFVDWLKVKLSASVQPEAYASAITPWLGRNYEMFVLGSWAGIGLYIAYQVGNNFAQLYATNDQSH